MEDKNIDIKVTVQTDKAVENLDDLKKSADKAANSVEKVSDAGKDVDKAIPTVNGLGDAWEQVFDNVTEALGPTGASLKKIFASVKAAIPTIKTLNSTALTGLRGIKAAIASTGIGILILALGEIVAHWEDIVEWTGLGKEAQEAYNRAVEAAKNHVEELSVLEERRKAILTAQGATQVELAQFDIEASQRKLDLIKKEIREIDRRTDLRKKDKKEQIQNLTDEWNAENRNLWLLKEKLKTAQAVGKINEENKNKEDSTKDYEKQLGNLEKLNEKLQSTSKNAWATIKFLAEEEQKGSVKSTGGFFTELLKPETISQETDKVVSYIKKAFAELNAAKEEGVEDLTITPELYEGLLAGDAFVYTSQIKEQNAQRERLFAEGKISLEENLKEELRIQEEAYLNEETLLLKRKKFLEEYGSGQDLEKVISDLKILEDERATYIANQNARIAKAAADAKAKMEAESAAAREAQLEVERKKLENEYRERERIVRVGEQNLLKIRNSFKLSKAIEQNQLDQIENLKKYYQELYNTEVDPNVKASILEDLRDLEEEKTEILAQGVEERRQLRLEEVLSYADAANSIADIFGTVAEAEEERIQRQLDAGKISEEAAKSQFETVKQWQYAQTWINTIAGMTAALTAPSMQATGPAGWVAAATQAASLLATGIAQTIKIKNTEFNGGGVSSGGSGISASPSVTPIDVRDDIQQSPTVLPDSQSPRNQRVYILERDIQDSNRRVEIRENNSTF